MGFREITLKLPTDYSEDALQAAISKELGIQTFSWQVESKSLDARKKSAIHWLIRTGVLSPELKGGEPATSHELLITRKKRTTKAVVVGSGPAGFFAALVLQEAGYNTILIERGSNVAKRAEAIERFETTANFDPHNNYAFGEGGAGTFSDGKLTARTKKIAREKQFILASYIRAGAPSEIAYLTHPHLGTDNLRHIAVNLRQEFLNLGGEIRFDCQLTDLVIKNGKVTSAVTTTGDIDTDVLIIAPGHSAHETYRMLIGHGVRFTSKNFSIGCRIEHPQQLINTAQWGRPSLPGVKAAEYRLTAPATGHLPVYTFCMCPGGMVVPATAYSTSNIVNGMSHYSRGGHYANAACVAGFNLESLLQRAVAPGEALDWLGKLERSFYEYSSGYQAPFTSIAGFITQKAKNLTTSSSYPLGLTPAPLWDMLPAEISRSIAAGLSLFCKKLKGFESGIILGLESKTSSPIQAVRELDRSCPGFTNLYLAGEGSGWAGGIISSGVDGIKTALSIINKDS